MKIGLFAAVLMVIVGGFLAAAGAGMFTAPPRQFEIRPASADESQAHDLHRQLELIRVCRTAPTDVWPCATATPDVTR